MQKCAKQIHKVEECPTWPTVDLEKAFDRIHSPPITAKETLNKLGAEGDSLSLLQDVYENKNQINNITDSDERLKDPSRSRSKRNAISIQCCTTEEFFTGKLDKKTK